MQAAMAAVESRALIDGVDKGPNLSESQMLDCVNAANGYRSRGCNGGLAGELVVRVGLCRRGRGANRLRQHASCVPR